MFIILLALSSMKSEKNQLVSDEDENNRNGLVEIIEVDATVEADEDSNTENESEHRGVDAKEEKFHVKTMLRNQKMKVTIRLTFSPQP